MSLAAAGSVAAAACAGTRERIVLEPGLQMTDATVDVEAGSVTAEHEGVVVIAQAAMMPAPRRRTLHPAFWVTVENTRSERISLRPAQARLIDTFGNQLEPLSMSAGGGGREVGYALVDPEVHTYVSLHYGWPYYPLYPYPGWFVHPRFSRLRYWHYDPFWTLGVGPVWVFEIRPRPPVRPPPPADPYREEVVYAGARVTYMLVFPEIQRSVTDVRLVIPEVSLHDEAAPSEPVEFEVVFEQLVEVDER